MQFLEDDLEKCAFSLSNSINAVHDSNLEVLNWKAGVKIKDNEQRRVAVHASNESLITERMMKYSRPKERR